MGLKALFASNAVSYWEERGRLIEGKGMGQVLFSYVPETLGGGEEEEKRGSGGRVKGKSSERETDRQTDRQADRKTGR